MQSSPTKMRLTTAERARDARPIRRAVAARTVRGLRMRELHWAVRDAINSAGLSSGGTKFGAARTAVLGNLARLRPNRPLGENLETPVVAQRPFDDAVFE